jgi:multidrug efflux pump subunit AcrA (membrane-fusion protein)
MTTSGPFTAEYQIDGPGESPSQRGPHRRRWVVLAVVVLVAAAGVVGVVDPFSARHATSTGVTDNAESTALATVTRQDLSEQTEVSATLGYAGSYTVFYQANGTGSPGSGSSGSAGTFTELPAVGQVVSEGQVLYRVDNSPVVLLYGATPAYRSLSEGASASEVTGPDVQELNADLVTLGYVTSSELSPTSDEFGYWTKVGVERLQAALGVTQSGTLPLGQALFLPTAARVTSVSADLGGAAQSGGTVLQATSTTRQVSIALDASQQSEVAVGDKVTITLPNNQTTSGVISSVGTVASTGSSSGSSSGSSGGSSSGGGSTGGGSGSSSPTITVLVKPTDPAATGTWDQAPVNVTITTASAINVLVVPIDALLAQPGGGYAVEVVDPDGTHRLVDIAMGIVDQADGLVQVIGAGLAAGQRVVVPNG